LMVKNSLLSDGLAFPHKKVPYLYEIMGFRISTDQRKFYVFEGAKIDKKIENSQGRRAQGERKAQRDRTGTGSKGSEERLLPRMACKAPRQGKSVQHKILGRKSQTGTAERHVKEHLGWNT